MLAVIRSYIETIAYFTVFSIFLQLLIGQPQHGVNFIIGIIMLLLICRPLEALFRVEFEFPAEFAEMSVQNYDKLREDIITDGIKAELEQELVRRTDAERAVVVLNPDNTVKSVTLYNADPSQTETAALLSGTENIILMEE